MTSSSFFDIEPLDCGVTCRCAMDACALCGKRLAEDRDIFMYRGDTPFCSEECRYRQMVSDHVSAEQHQRHRQHEAPVAAKAKPAARVQVAAKVPVAI